MTRRRWKIAGFVALGWIAATILSAITGCGFPGIINYVTETEYGCSEPEVIDGIWIRPCVNSTSYGFMIPLIFSYSSTGAPFSVGLTAIDYDDSNQCRTLVIDQLCVSVEGNRKIIVHEGEGISAAFEKYLSGARHVKADCYVDIGHITYSGKRPPVHVEAHFTIHTASGMIKQSVSGQLEPGGWKGFWFIPEALSPD